MSTKAPRGKQWFTWTVQLSVHKTWVEDGFDLTDARALRMLEQDLDFANESELHARVVKAPNADRIAKEMGYADAEDRKAKRR